MRDRLPIYAAWGQRTSAQRPISGTPIVWGGVAYEATGKTATTGTKPNYIVWQVGK